MSRVLGLGLKPQPHTPSTGPARPKRNAARPRLAPWHRQVKVVHGRLRILDREVGTTGAARHLAARKHQERQAKNARDIRCKGVTAEDVSTSPRCRTHPGRGDLIDQRSTCFYSTSWPLAHPILYSTKRPFAPRKQKKVNATQQQRVTQPLSTSACVRLGLRKDSNLRWRPTLQLYMKGVRASSLLTSKARELLKRTHKLSLHKIYSLYSFGAQKKAHASLNAPVHSPGAHLHPQPKVSHL